MVNYRVRNLDAMLAQLRAAGARVDDRVEDYDYGSAGRPTQKATDSNYGSRANPDSGKGTDQRLKRHPGFPGCKALAGGTDSLEAVS
jgi:hypothetical protein